MAFNCRAFLLAVLVAAATDLFGKASAATYVVGDNQGWRVPTTPNDYSTWAGRYVFRAGDVLGKLQIDFGAYFYFQTKLAN